MDRRANLGSPLRDEPFFRGISDRVVVRIEGLVYHRKYESRQIIFFPGDLCDQVYWVRDGRVKIMRASGKQAFTFRHLFAGDMFGEECLAKTGKRDAYAEALEPTVLCLMRADDFKRLVSEEHELSVAIADWLARRVVQTEDVLSETVFKTVRGRVASGLLRLYQRVPQEERGTLRVTHQEIANLVGSTRETTTSVLHDLRAEGIVNMANRRVTVLDPIALEHAARSG